MTKNPRHTPTTTAATPTPAAQSPAGANGADPRATGPTNLDQLNESFCAMVRLAKALIATAITAGAELADARRELGDGFPQFVAARTPWNLAEVEAVIRFAAEVGLQSEQLTPAVSVPLGRMLAAAGLLGELYMEQQQEGNGQG
jgi:hypothetical protein